MAATPQVCISCTSKTSGATRTIPTGSLNSHETTPDKQIKHFWREPLPVLTSVFYTGFSELLDTKYVNDISHEVDSSMDGDASFILSVMLLFITNHQLLQA